MSSDNNALVPFEDNTQMVVHDNNIQNDDDGDDVQTKKSSPPTTEQQDTNQMIVYSGNDDQENGGSSNNDDDNGQDDKSVDDTYDNVPRAEGDTPKKKKKKKKKVVTPPKKKGILERLLPDEDGREPILKDPYRQYRNQKCIFICTTIAVIFAYCSVLTCDFLKVGDEDLSFNELEGRGPFFQGSYSNGTKLGCIRYDESQAEINIPLKWSQVGGGTLMALIAICWLMVVQWFLFSSNMITKKFIHLMLRITFPICLLTNMFILTKMYGIPECSEQGSKCTPGIAAIIAVINTFILGYLAIMIFLIPPPTHPLLLVDYENIPKKEPDVEFVQPPPKKSKKKKKDDEENGNYDNDEEPQKDDIVETTIEVVPTGTKKTHYITHPDGTQSVKEEFIPKATEIV